MGLIYQYDQQRTAVYPCRGSTLVAVLHHGKSCDSSKCRWKEALPPRWDVWVTDPPERMRAPSLGFEHEDRPTSRGGPGQALYGGRGGVCCGMDASGKAGLSERAQLAALLRPDAGTESERQLT